MLVETLAAASTRVGPAPPRGGGEAALLAFLAQAARAGIPGALATICGVDGGSPKGLGAHMAVLADGRHAGYISGGCVEPAVAAEIVPVVATGRDQVIRFGKGSCFIDIRFPCGGGVDLLVHVQPRVDVLDEALARLARREPFALAFDPETSTVALQESAPRPTGWHDGVFVRRYLPRTRLLLAGRGPDFEVLARAPRRRRWSWSC